MIRFFTEDVIYHLQNKPSIKTWIHNVIWNEGFIPGEINIIFCSDAYLLNINRSFLNHDYETDIITFPTTETEEISGELYISLDRVQDNAALLKLDFLQELHRVIIHGILHLCGYDDKKPSLKQKMSAREDFYLSLRNFL